MQMKESSLWQYIHSGLKLENILMTRIESSAGNGVPDVAATAPGKHLWIELKYIKEWPKRPTTKVKLPLRPEQRLWINTRGKLGGDVWVICRIEDDFFLLNWNEACLACEGWTKIDWLCNSSRCWYKRIDFTRLYNILKGGCNGC